MIAKFTRIYVTRFTDNGQVTAHAAWVDHKGRTGQTEGSCEWTNNPRRISTPTFGTHMHALFAAAKRQGLRLERETW